MRMAKAELFFGLNFAVGVGVGDGVDVGVDIVMSARVSAIPVSNDDPLSNSINSSSANGTAPDVEVQ